VWARPFVPCVLCANTRTRVVCVPRACACACVCVRVCMTARSVTQVNATRSSRTDSRVATECSAPRGISTGSPLRSVALAGIHAWSIVHGRGLMPSLHRFRRQ
jgi:hypothetical protein